MKLSATLIVKDEEKFLPGCLDSIKDLVDEIVIVDTGSSDRTVEIAKSYGAKVYHHPWENDFSLHRNQAFSYASGEWFFVIDADERLPEDFPASTFRERLEKLPENVKALLVTVHEKSNGASAAWRGARFFKADGKPHYVNCVHNQPKFVGIAAGTDVDMIHLGYSLSPDAMQRKFLRSLALLEGRLEKDPDDYNALFYKSLTLMGMSLYDQAIEAGVRCMELLPVKDHTEMACYGMMYYALANAYLKRRDVENAWRWANKGLEFWPDDIDLNYAMTLIGWLCKLDDTMRIHGQRYLDLMEQRNTQTELTKFENHQTDLPVSPRQLNTATTEFYNRVKGWLES